MKKKEFDIFIATYDPYVVTDIRKIEYLLKYKDGSLIACLMLFINKGFSKEKILQKTKISEEVYNFYEAYLQKLGFI